MKDFENCASSLYDGGWRSADQEDIQAEYGFTNDEVNHICELLAKFEVEENQKTFKVKYFCTAAENDYTLPLESWDEFEESAIADDEEEAIDLLKTNIFELIVELFSNVERTDTDNGKMYISYDSDFGHRSYVYKMFTAEQC